MSKEALIASAIESIEKYDIDLAEKICKEVIAEGIDPVEVIDEGFTKGMRKIGTLFSNQEIPLPVVVLAAEVIQKAIELLEPHIPEKSKGKPVAKVVIGTVEGDIHDIGKNIVATMMRVYGFEVYDVGRDVPAKVFIDKAKEVGADFIASSTMMTTTMPGQKALETQLKESGLKVFTLVGGAPVNQHWADKIGADIYGADAAEAIEKAKELAGGGSK